MTPKEYADKKYKNFPTYHKIAMDAFKAGQESVKPDDVIKLKQELRNTKKELKELWKTIEDPEAFAELIAGL